MDPITIALGVASAASGIMANSKAKKNSKRASALQKEAQLKDIAYQRGELEHAKVDLLKEARESAQDAKEGLGERFEGAGSTSGVVREGLNEVEYQKQKRLAALKRRMGSLSEHEDLTQRGWALQNSIAESQATMQLINTLINSGISGVGAMYGAQGGGGNPGGVGAGAGF